MAIIVISHTITLQEPSGTILDSRDLTVSLTVSQVAVQRLNLAHGVSEFVLSLPNLSNPSVLYLAATSLCRVHWSGTSSTGLASAGQQFKDLFVLVGSGMSGMTGVHVANSSGDSAVVTAWIGM